MQGKTRILTTVALGALVLAPGMLHAQEAATVTAG
ncbi:hypothetical protein GGQ98_003355 [Sphingosinicella soli]|uniref:Uncharacterized protein n=1 Tax=Sphingosinicella soli TaxID=333708 RepID=A0A7W7B607_9SPHN|nr:hypothetical protein [Sphingosinicella soli]